jgi:hypothetical protein
VFLQFLSLKFSYPLLSGRDFADLLLDQKGLVVELRVEWKKLGKKEGMINLTPLF